MNNNSSIDTIGIAQQILEDLASSIPNILKALVVFIIGYIIAKLVTKLLLAGLQKAGVDKLKDKLDEIEFVSKSNISFKPSIAIAKSIYYLILLAVTITVVEILQIDAITDLLKELVVLLPNLFVAVIILIIGLLIAEAIRKMVQGTCESLGIPAAKVIATFVFFFVMINALMIALKKATIPSFCHWLWFSF